MSSEASRLPSLAFGRPSSSPKSKIGCNIAKVPQSSKFASNPGRPEASSKQPYLFTSEAELSVVPKTTVISAIQEGPRISAPDHACDDSGSKRHPHFIAAHLGSPCTLGALDHHLKCGHKISTDQPELCATNCKGSTSRFQKERSIDKAFVCMTCIVSDIKIAHDAKVSSFKDELRAIASATRKQMSRDEVARRVEVIEIGWRELDLMKIRERLEHGRMSRPFYIEPDYADAVETVTQERYYDKIEQGRGEPPRASGSSIAEGLASPGSPASSSSAALKLASRSPSPTSSKTSVSAQSARSKLPFLRR